MATQQRVSGAVRGAFRAGLMLIIVALTATSVRADNFVKPTKEELEMTSLTGYPGVPAVVLFREDITQDDLHVMTRYERVKILTEDGKKYANVELPFVASTYQSDFTADDKMVGDITGRTIHPDGTIVPFTGKPYLKLIENVKGIKFQQKIFTLPDVTVGSIIEYRYRTSYNDNVYESPDWYIQGELYVKAAHYQWFPTAHDMVNEDGKLVNSISWFPVLPDGAKLEHRELPHGSMSNAPTQVYELSIKDVPPKQHEEFMPPLSSYSYRVLFNFTPYRTGQDFWMSEGKRWSKKADSFIGSSSELREATTKVIAGANTQDEKLRKIYAAVMALDNTEYTRERDRKEEKADGLKEVKSAWDVYDRKRGTPRQLAMLFVAMARSANMKAHLMLVPDRSEELFTSMWMSFSQFDHTIAIVNVDGKDKYLDPGQRYCPYGHLAWQDTWVNGLRQADSGVEFAVTPGENYPENNYGRVADLKMDEHGAISGVINLKMTGSPALYWRQQALKGDKESIEHNLNDSVEKMMPGTLEIKLKEINNLEDYEKPLLASFDVKGTLGTPTGKRLVIPVDPFRSGSVATFPHEKRELPVYFSYPQITQDAFRIVFPKNMTLEASPESSNFTFQQFGAYAMKVIPATNSVTIRRDYLFNSVIVKKEDYAVLRTFYSQFETKDQDSVIFKMVPVETSSAAAPGAK